MRSTPRSTGERSVVQFGTTAIPYHVQRSARRTTVSIALDPKAGVLVTAPEDTPLARLDKIVRGKAEWILTRQKRLHGRVPAVPAREFISGEAFRYLGRQCRLRVEAGEGSRAVVALRGRELVVSIQRAARRAPDPALVRKALVAWYKRRAREYLGEKVARWAPRIGTSPRALRITEPRARWGSLAADGTLRLNWRIVQAAPQLIDYVVVHELVHLVHADHGREFWATVAGVLPDYEGRRERLKEVGSTFVW